MILLYVFLSVFTLCAIITAHEWGHFITAKKTGCLVEEFAIGFGPALYKRTCKDGMKFSIRAIPLGGFCQIAGESSVSASGDSSELLCNKKTWQQLLVFLAGVTINIILGAVLCIIGHLVYGNGLAEAVVGGLSTSAEHFTLVFKSLGMLFSGQVPLGEVGGIVGCVGMISEISAGAATLNVGLANFIVLMGFISTNLGVMNLLPIPALDGGRVFMIILNKISMLIRKKPLSEKVQYNAIAYTLYFMFGLMAVLVVKDIIWFFI